MHVLLNNIPIKIIYIYIDNLRLGRLYSRLTLLLYYNNIFINYVVAGSKLIKSYDFDKFIKKYNNKSLVVKRYKYYYILHKYKYLLNMSKHMLVTKKCNIKSTKFIINDNI